jgi:hypothetical protein
MAVDDHSLKRAARVCAGRDQGECRPSNPAQWCTRQGEVGLREGEWSRAYRECDRRRADEEAKHDGDRSRVCDVRELVRASHLGSLQKLPRWRAKILVALVKNVADWYVIFTLSVAIEICVCDLKIHQNIRDYNRRSEQRTHADQSFGPLLCTRTVSLTHDHVFFSCGFCFQSRGTKRKIGCRSVSFAR